MVSPHLLIRLKRLARTQEQIAEVVRLSQNRVSEIIGNTKFGEIDNLLSQGRDMDYIARHYHIDLPLAWAIRLEGKTGQERFEELGWGLRTWDQSNFNDCDEIFGDNWPARHRERSGEAGGPGRIPAQLVAHTLFYFTNPGDLVFDPMAGGVLRTRVSCIQQKMLVF